MSARQFLIIVSMLGATTGCVFDPKPDEASGLRTALVQRHTFAVRSKVVPDHPAVRSARLDNRSVISITGVTEAGEQEKVLAILRELHGSVATRPIIVRFYREEVLLTGDSPTPGLPQWRREDVDLLREVRID